MFEVATKEDIQAAVDKNFEAFQKLLPTLLPIHSGKYALMRDGQSVQVFDTAGDALIYAEDKFPDQLFSIQEINRRVVDLGWFSHAVHVGPV